MHQNRKAERKTFEAFTRTKNNGDEVPRASLDGGRLRPFEH